jgi:hypothetical protein
MNFYFFNNPNNLKRSLNIHFVNKQYYSIVLQFILYHFIYFKNKSILKKYQNN